MKLHRPPIAATLGATMIAAGVLAGCMATVDNAQPAPQLSPQAVDAAPGETGDGVLALTQRVNWTRVEAAAPIEGF